MPVIYIFDSQERSLSYISNSENMVRFTIRLCETGFQRAIFNTTDISKSSVSTISLFFSKIIFFSF